MENAFPATNPVWMMVNSGARGNMMQVRQIAGMRGLVSNPKGETIPRPIKANVPRGPVGAGVLHLHPRARKGLADTALRTADSGYLTRRLVDVAQDVIVREEDCGTDRGVPLHDRASGTRRARWSRPRTPRPTCTAASLAEDVEVDGKVIVPGGCRHRRRRRRPRWSRPASRRSASAACSICEAKIGVCAKCYGRSLATGKLVDVGEAVGIIAAQSIGEPGTQLTMRTFHTGGVAGDDITHGLPRVQELFEARIPKGVAPITEAEGRVRIDETDKTRKIVVVPDDGSEEIAYPVSHALAPAGHRRRARRRSASSSSPVRSTRTRCCASSARGRCSCTWWREVQEVYRSQGVSIHDKHIEIIMRQMLKRVNVLESGDTELLPGELVERPRFEADEPRGGGRGRQPGRRPSGAHGHHQGVAGDRVVAVGGLLPGDDPGAHRRGDPRQVRLAARA